MMFSLSSTDKDFLALLRAGLWHNADVQLSAVVAWEEIYHLAESQTVIGLVGEGIEQYRNVHPEVDIPHDISERFFDDALEIIRRNQTTADLQHKAIGYLRHHGIDVYLLKGHSLAQYYPAPNLRMSGDIDLLVSRADYARACELLQQVAGNKCGEHSCEDHAAFHFGENVIEVHASTMGVLHDGSKEKLDNLLDKVFATPDKAVRTLPSDDTLPLLPLEVEALYVFLHIVKHLKYEGVGLRQVIDWMLFLEANRDYLNMQQLEDEIAHFGYLKEYRVLSAFHAELLTDNVAPHPSWHSRLLWYKIRTFGNMGHELRARIWGTTYHPIVHKLQTLKYLICYKWMFS